MSLLAGENKVTLRRFSHLVFVKDVCGEVLWLLGTGSVSWQQGYVGVKMCLWVSLPRVKTIMDCGIFC